MARTPPPEGYRYDNQPPASHPTRSAYQRDQSFGWVPPAASGSNPNARRTSKWIGIGDASAHPIFGAYEFTVADQKSGSRGQRRPPYGS